MADVTVLIANGNATETDGIGVREIVERTYTDGEGLEELLATPGLVITSVDSPMATKRLGTKLIRLGGYPVQ